MGYPRRETGLADVDAAAGAKNRELSVACRSFHRSAAAMGINTSSCALYALQPPLIAPTAGEDPSILVSHLDLEDCVIRQALSPIRLFD